MADGRSDVRVENGKIVFPCPTCGKHLRAPADKAGEAGTCPACKGGFATPLPGKGAEEVFTGGMKEELKDVVTPNPLASTPEPKTLDAVAPPPSEQSFFLVTGVDNKTAEERTIQVVAADVRQALEIAKMQGVFPRTAVRDIDAEAERLRVAEEEERIRRQVDTIRKGMRSQSRVADAPDEGREGSIKTLRSLIELYLVISILVAVVMLFFGISSIGKGANDGALFIGISIGFILQTMIISVFLFVFCELATAVHRIRGEIGKIVDLMREQQAAGRVAKDPEEK